MMSTPIYQFLSFLLILIAPVVAIAADCPPANTSAWASASQLCASQADGEGCFAAGSIQLDKRDGAPADAFSAPGSIDRSRMLKAVHPAADGLFVIKTAAHLKSDDATIVVFGGVTLDDLRTGKYVPSTPTPTTPEATGEPGFTLQATTWFDGTMVRDTPSLVANPITKLPKDATVTIDGRTGQGLSAYLHITTSDGKVGWIEPSLLNAANGKTIDTSPDFNKLPQVNGSTSTRTGVFIRLKFTGSPCADSGLLIQSPHDGDHARFTLNGSTMILGSTIFVYTDSNGDDVYVTLEGTNVIYTDTGIISVPAGSQIRRSPDGTLSALEPYDPAVLTGLPIGLLPDDIVPPTPLTPQQIANLNAQIANPNAGTWSLDLFDWQVQGDCPYPPSAISAIGDVRFDWVWDGNPQDLIAYWTSGQSQQFADANGVHYDFTQAGPNLYVFNTQPSGSDNQAIEVDFQYVTGSFIGVTAIVRSGASCTLKAQGLIIYSAPA